MRNIPYIYPLKGKKYKWRVFIRHRGKQFFVGDFVERVNAFVAYNVAAFKLGIGLVGLVRRRKKLDKAVRDERDWMDRIEDETVVEVEEELRGTELSERLFGDDEDKDA